MACTHDISTVYVLSYRFHTTKIQRGMCHKTKKKNLILIRCHHGVSAGSFKGGDKMSFSRKRRFS